MKRTEIKILSLIVSAIFSAVIVPAGLSAQEGGVEGLHTNKNSTYDNSTHQGKITLETFVEGEVKVIKESGPAEVVLLLDLSNSLSEEDAISMKAAAVSFVESLAAESNESEDNFRVSVVGFAGKAVLWCGLTYVYAEKETLIDKISNIYNPGETGTTYTGRALNWATALLTGIYPDDMCSKVNTGCLSANYNTYENPSGAADEIRPRVSLAPIRENASKFVVLFSDGAPSDNGDDDVKLAYNLKQQGVKVYTIGFKFDPNSKYDQPKIQFMNAVSSNYPNAQKMSDVTDITTHDYFSLASDNSMLQSIFGNISQEVIHEVAAMDLTEETVLKDFINKVYFKLPDNATKADISVYTRPFERIDENNQYVFGTVTTKIPVKDVDPDGVVDIIFSQENGNDCVSVTGYSYKDNWVGFDISRNPHGCELVVEIPFVFKDGVELDGNLDTNTEGSGIYTPDNPDEPVEPYPVPSLSFKELTITRSGLESGESAIYNVYSVNQGNKLVYTVVLTGTSADGSNSASKTITGVLARDSEGNYYGYEVTESDWDWAYNKDVNNNSKTSAYTDDSGNLEFAFQGAHKEETLGSDAYKQHHTEVKKSDRISKTN